MHDRLDKDNCCDDKAEFFKADEDKQVPSAGLELPKTPGPITVALTVLYIGLFAEIASSLTYLLFKPPIASDDFQSLLQIFRI